MLVRCRNRAEVGYYEVTETGWFGSKLVKKVGKAVSKVAKVATKIPGVKSMVAPISLASDIAKGKNIGKSIVKQGKTTVADTRAALPIAATVASFVPGIGTGVAAGLSGAAALSQGKSLKDIAADAALGAIPGGLAARAVLRAGIGVAKGQNVLKTVAKEGVRYAKERIGGGELVQRGLDIAVAGAQGHNLLKSAEAQALDYARTHGGALVGSAANVALQAAHGQNIAKAAGREALSVARANLPSLPANVNSVVSAVTSRIPKVPMNLTRPNFGMPASVSPENIARVRQVSVGRRRPNMSPKISPTARRTASFRPLSMATRGFLVKALPHMAGEISGLSETGAQWIVEKGDTGSKIALKLTGNANRWTELRSVNPKIMGRGADLVKKYGFPIYVNDLVNLPASWIKVSAQTPAQTAPNAPSPATPPPVSMPSGDIAAQGQARTILVAWGKSDGKNEAGIPDYGSQSELMATNWSARDVLQGNSFANWWRRFGGPPAVDDGNWSETLSVALNRWAEQKANQVTNTALAAGGIVVPPIAGPVPPPTPAPVAALPSPSISLPSPWAGASPAGSTPAQISLPQVTITPSDVPMTFPPVVVNPPTPTSVAQANVAPQSKPGFTESQKWGLGSMVAGTAISILVRLIAA